MAHKEHILSDICLFFLNLRLLDNSVETCGIKSQTGGHSFQIHISTWMLGSTTRPKKLLLIVKALKGNGCCNFLPSPLRCS